MRFTKDHEWVEVEGDTATIGITAYAADQLGDVVFVELPVAGRGVKSGEAMAVVESVKAASDVYTPVSGEIVEVNQAIAGEPSRINAEAEGAAWLFKLRMDSEGDLAGLMDEAAYRAFAGDEAH